MTELKLSQLQQRFFLAILEGKSPIEAIQTARANKLPVSLSRLKAQAHELTNDPAVQAALARARSELQARVELRVEDLVEQLMEARQVALYQCDPPQANAAVAATMGAAKLLGLVIDRKDINVTRDKPSPVAAKQLELTEEEWKRTFALKP